MSAWAGVSDCTLRENAKIADTVEAKWSLFQDNEEQTVQSRAAVLTFLDASYTHGG